MTPSTLALARRVRALLEAPERWTQGAAARDAGGKMVKAASPEAAAWSLDGALLKARRELGGEGSRRLSRELKRAANTMFLDLWNDHPRVTHADVLALLDRVIAEGER